MPLDKIPAETPDAYSDVPSQSLHRPLIFRRNIARTGKEQFESLDFLRVVAALMIVLFHAQSIAQKSLAAQGTGFFPCPVFWYSSIELFFVMSGFLILHTSKALYGAPHGSRTLALRRALRIVPLYWVFTFFIAVLFLLKPAFSVDGPIHLKIFLASLTFIPTGRPPVMAIAWTLNFEMFFYAIAALSAFLPFDKGWKFVVLVLTLLVAAGQLLHIRTAPFIVWTDPLMMDFAIGVLIAAAFHAGVTLSSRGALVSSFGGIVLIFCYPKLANYDLLRPATMGMGMGGVLAGVTLRERPLSFGRFRPLISKISEQSYTMYLCHILVLKSLQLVYFRAFSGFWAGLGFILLGTIITLAVSQILFLLLEKPLTESLRTHAKKRKLI